MQSTTLVSGLPNSSLLAAEACDENANQYFNDVSQNDVRRLTHLPSPGRESAAADGLLALQRQRSTPIHIEMQKEMIKQNCIHPIKMEYTHSCVLLSATGLGGGGGRRAGVAGLGGTGAAAAQLGAGGRARGRKRSGTRGGPGGAGATGENLAGVRRTASATGRATSAEGGKGALGGTCGL